MNITKRILHKNTILRKRRFRSMGKPLTDNINVLYITCTKHDELINNKQFQDSIKVLREHNILLLIRYDPTNAYEKNELEKMKKYGEWNTQSIINAKKNSYSYYYS